MVSCENFCTVEKCQELEQQINNLELEILLLKAQIADLAKILNQHMGQSIPDAHDYDPESIETFVTVDVFSQDANNFVIKVSVNGDSDEDSFTLDTSTDKEENFQVKSNLKGSAIVTGNTLQISIADGQSQDVFTVDLPFAKPEDIPKLEIPPPLVNLDLAIEGNTLNVAIDVGNPEGDFSSDWATVQLPSPSVNLDLGIEGNTLNAAIDVGNPNGNFSTDWATVQLPSPSVNLDLGIEGNTLNAAIDVGNSSDWATVNLPVFEPNVLVDVFEQGDKTAIIKVTVNDDSDEDILLLPTFDPNDMNCDDLEQLIIDSFNNLDNQLGNLDNQINLLEDSIKDDIKDISDKVEVIDNCVCTDISGLTVNEFECLPPSESNPNYTSQNDTFNYSGIGLNGLHQLVKTINNNLLSIYQAECDQLNQKGQDVVAIVASPKVVTNLEGNVLILHFVTLDNYPKRKANSHYRAIQIPAAKITYNWDTDFKDLRWQQGNQYGELTLTEYKSKVSGWFENIDRANSFFDAVLGLTNATESNRNFPNHSNPRTDIIVQETRPYRAFISTVNNDGNGTVLNKYFPPQDGT